MAQKGLRIKIKGADTNENHSTNRKDYQYIFTEIATQHGSKNERIVQKSEDLQKLFFQNLSGNLFSKVDIPPFTSKTETKSQTWNRSETHRPILLCTA